MMFLRTQHGFHQRLQYGLLSAEKMNIAKHLSKKVQHWVQIMVCGVTIGEYAFIGAGAVVNQDVQAFALMVGVPSGIGWMSTYGERVDLPTEGNVLGMPSYVKYIPYLTTNNDKV